jgi:hypothetical protein
MESPTLHASFTRDHPTMKVATRNAARLSGMERFRLGDALSERQLLKSTSLTK